MLPDIVGTDGYQSLYTEDHGKQREEEEQATEEMVGLCEENSGRKMVPYSKRQNSMGINERGLCSEVDKKWLIKKKS